jgi:large subunit ribosomal protein L15
LAKRGFRQPFAVQPSIVNLRDLERFEAGTVVDVDVLRAAGLVRGEVRNLRILGQGEISKALVVRAHGFSASATAKIEAAGGKAEQTPAPTETA